MKWRYVKKLRRKSLIQKFESHVNYTFPSDFKECVKKNNGGRPEKVFFDSDTEEGRNIKCLLSFNFKERENMWDMYRWDSADRHEKGFNGKYIPFAVDNYGNCICFDTSDDSVVVVEHEDRVVEKIADSFSSFLNCLYSYNSSLYDKLEFRQSIKNLKAKVTEYKKERKFFTRNQLKQINDFQTPDGYIWHHDIEPGNLQLVDTLTHRRTPHIGGRVIWGDRKTPVNLEEKFPEFIQRNEREIIDEVDEDVSLEERLANDQMWFEENVGADFTSFLRSSEFFEFLKANEPADLSETIRKFVDEYGVDAVRAICSEVAETQETDLYEEPEPPKNYDDVYEDMSLEERITNDQMWFEENVGGNFMKFIMSRKFFKYLRANRPISLSEAIRKYVDEYGVDAVIAICGKAENNK